MADNTGVSTTAEDASEVYGTPEHYLKLWESKSVPWHSDKIEPALAKHHEAITRGKSCAVVFFPFCGKDPGMKLMADVGHKVIGVELSPIGCRDFYIENNMDFTEEKINEKVISFKSKNGKINLFGCNFMDYEPAMACEVDVIWDRGAIQAVTEGDDLNKYVDKIKSMFRPGVVNYTCIDNFEDWENLTKEKLQELFGEGLTVENYDVVPALEEYHKMGIKNVNVYKITMASH